MSPPSFKCWQCNGEVESAGSGRWRCVRCGHVWEPHGADPETYAGRVEDHAGAVDYLVRLLNRHCQPEIERTGVDPRSDGGAVAVGGPRTAATKPPDIEANGVPIDVKSTRQRRYFGNARDYHLKGYSPETWIAAFVIDGGEVVESGSYRVGDVDIESATINMNNDDEVFIDVDPGPIEDLLHAVKSGTGNGPNDIRGYF